MKYKFKWAIVLIIRIMKSFIHMFIYIFLFLLESDRSCTEDGESGQEEEEDNPQVTSHQKANKVSWTI